MSTKRYINIVDTATGCLEGRREVDPKATDSEILTQAAVLSNKGDSK